MTPGDTITVRAVANKRAGVEYQWDIPGTWETRSDGIVAWTIPGEPGDYVVSVTAIDTTTGTSARRSATVTVGDGHALAAPEAFNCTIRSSTTFTNKLVGVQEITDQTTMRTLSDGSVEVTTVTPAGETIRTISDDEGTYAIDDTGARELIARDDGSLGRIPACPQLISLESLIAACPDYVRNGRYLTFTQSSGTASATIVFDEQYGVVVRTRIDNEETAEVSDVKVDYAIVDGYLLPTKIDATIEYYMGEELFSVRMVQNFDDIVLNPIAEEGVI